MFFHVSHTIWPTPCGLDHGNWGRTIRRISSGGDPLGGNGLIFAWEVALETARRALANEKPSRLEAFFLAPTLEAAQRFRDRYRAGAAIFQAIPMDAASAIHIGDFDLISGGMTGPLIDAFVDRAEAYWTKTPSGLPEVLVGGPVMLTTRIE